MITRTQLDALERAADKVFKKLGIDIEFTNHFLDRVNDARNKKPITIQELGILLAKEYQQWGRNIAGMPIDTQAVMKDISTAINIPFVIDDSDDDPSKEKELVAKTVMRKQNFKTSNQVFPVENTQHRSEKQKLLTHGSINIVAESMIQREIFQDYKLNEKIIPREVAIARALMKFVDSELQAHPEWGVTQAADKASKAFNISKTAREITAMWKSWKSSGEYPDVIS